MGGKQYRKEEVKSKKVFFGYIYLIFGRESAYSQIWKISVGQKMVYVLKHSPGSTLIELKIWYGLFVHLITRLFLIVIIPTWWPTSS